MKMTNNIKLLRNSGPSKTSRKAQINYVQMALALLARREREKARNCQAHAQYASRALTEFTRFVKKGVIVLLIALALGTTQAEPREHRHERRKPEPNWILRRQEIGAVEGVPTTRRIIGKREIDIYRNGMMFERDHVVGVKGGSR